MIGSEGQLKKGEGIPQKVVGLSPFENLGNNGVYISKGTVVGPGA